VIIRPENEKLVDFLSQFYDVVKPDGVFDPERTIFYSDRLGIKNAAEVRCRYVWSGSVISPETRKFLAGDKIIIEGKNIKDEYIARFLGNCSA
jgi:hypothetical protein